MAGEKYWIALNRVKGIGLANLKHIHQELERTGLNMVDLFDLSPGEMKEEFSFSERITAAFGEARAQVDEVEELVSDLLESRVSLIPFFSPHYPQRLLKTMGNSAPPLLYVLGNRNLLHEPGAAVLGDRNISSRGEMVAYLGSRELCRHRVLVISGMSTGAGVIAHRSSLECGGRTLAIIPSGIFTFKLPQLLEEVYDPDRFAIASPFFPHDPADKYHAYARNRVICGLSHAVFIVEAPAEGGIFEAAKSARDLEVPLYTTEYATSMDENNGNRKILEEMGGKPVRGRMVNDTLTPNMDAILADVKFDQS